MLYSETKTFLVEGLVKICFIAERDEEGIAPILVVCWTTTDGLVYGRGFEGHSFKRHLES